MSTGAEALGGESFPVCDIQFYKPDIGVYPDPSFNILRYFRGLGQICRSAGGECQHTIERGNPFKKPDCFSLVNQLDNDCATEQFTLVQDSANATFPLNAAQEGTDEKLAGQTCAHAAPPSRSA